MGVGASVGVGIKEAVGVGIGLDVGVGEWARVEVGVVIGAVVEGNEEAMGTGVRVGCAADFGEVMRLGGIVGIASGISVVGIDGWVDAPWHAAKSNSEPATINANAPTIANPLLAGSRAIPWR